MLQTVLALVLAVFAAFPPLAAQAQTTPSPVSLVEYYHAALDHYFLTASPYEQAQLDSGATKGWTRTGESFTGYAPNAIPAGASPVCRFYGRPEAGIDSHFYSASPEECAAVVKKFASTWIHESANVFQLALPDTSTGTCSSRLAPVYRLFNNRTDVNHRYTTDTAIRDEMKALGYISEGYGDDGVAFCALSKSSTTSKVPTAGGIAPVVTVSVVTLNPSTFAFSGKATLASGATATSYSWNFGDGMSSAGAAPTHQYAASGTYTVTLTVTDSTGSKGTATKSVTAQVASTAAAPTASIGVLKNTPDTFTFTANSTVAAGATIVSRTWSFGDGATALGSPLTKGYAASGNYVVTLTVVDSNSRTATATTTVSATVATGPAAPTVKVVATQSATDTFAFSSSVTLASGASITSQTWSFGDGASASGASATNRYAATGTYVVTHTVKDSNNQVATGTATVSAVVQTAPPPTTTPIPGTRRINVSMAQTQYEWVSQLLRKRWKNQATGDWRDRSDVRQGSTPYGTISVAPNSQPAWYTVSGPELTALATRLVADNTGIHFGIIGNATTPRLHGHLDANPPVLTVVTSTGTFRPRLIFAKSRDNNAGLRAPGFLKFDMSGITGTVQSASLALYVATVYTIYQPLTLTINYLDTPYVDALPFVATPAFAPDIQDIQFLNRDEVFRDMTSGNTNTWTYSPEFKVDTQYNLPYLRAGFDTSNQRSINWVKNVTPRKSIYVSFMHRIEPGLWDAQHESGMKLTAVGGANWYFALWHTLNAYDKVTRDEANPRLWGLTHYMYENGTAQQLSPESWAILEEGRWYHFEMYIQMNNSPLADGVATAWVNGNQVFSRNDLRWEPTTQGTVNGIQWQLYEGGAGSFPYADHWIHAAQFRAGSQRVGVPSRMLNGTATTTPPPTTTPTGTLPAWRAAMSKDRVAAIPLTSGMNGVTALGNGTRQGWFTIDGWNGLAASEGAWWAAANGGHDQGNGLFWENKVFKIDLTVAAPKWELAHPGSPWSMVTPNSDHYLDGLPVSRHSYYASQFIASRNRVMQFGAAAPYAIGFPAPAFQGGGIVDGFNPSTGQWDPAYTWASAPSDTFQTAMGVTKDPRTDDVYITGNTRFAKWTAATNTWSHITPKNADGTVAYYPSSGEFHPTLIDAKRNRWVLFSGTKWRSVDLSTQVITVHGDVTGALTSGAEDYSALVHDLDNDRYLTVQGTGLYAIDPDTRVSTFIATVPKAVNGVHNRLAYFAKLGGVAYLPAYSSDILFIPTR